MKHNLIYAAGYYPLMHDKSEWERDLKRMHDLGIRLIRTAELFNSWDQIEPEPGVFRFDFLDEFFDLCATYGMKILLGTGTASPPYWLHEMHPQVNILNNHNESYPNNVSYSWACIDNPDYRSACENYIRTLVSRYQRHEALYAYQIHNEIGFPFMPLKEGDVDLYCYCDFSVGQFRNWLKNKYQSLDAINRAYRWGATNTLYTTWEQVEPPRVKPTGWSSVTRWLDWRIFWMQNIVSFVKWQNDIIKTIDMSHITTTNIFFLKSQDPLGALTALDQFEMAKAVDIIGVDLYPGSGNKLENMPEFASMCLDLSRSTSAWLGKDYWLLEMESGPINGWILGPSRNVKGFDLERNVFEAIGHGAKLTLYQGFREWDFQPLHWGAIVDLDGEETERTEAAKKIGDVLSRYNRLFSEANTPKGKIAIVVSKENAIVVNGMGQETFLLKALRGAYTYFWQQNYRVDFITPEQIKQGYAKDYVLIYMPFMAVIPEELACCLAEYVEQGGNLVATARCGMLEEHGWYNHQIPCHSLQRTFGVSAFDAYAGEHPNITYKMKRYVGHWHREEVKILEPSASIIARFDDDSPAVVLNRYGKGCAIYFATHPDVGMMEHKSELLCDVLSDFLQRENILPEVELEYTNRSIKEIDAHYLADEQGGLLIITNYVQKTNSGFFAGGKKSIRVKINTERRYRKAVDLMTGSVVARIMDCGFMDIDIVENRVFILRLTED